jgi:hypothetical protein
MKKFGFIVLGIIVGIIIFAILTGIIAGIITALANSSWNPSSEVTMLIGVVSFLLKWGLSIYGGYKTYKILMRKVQKSTEVA